LEAHTGRRDGRTDGQSALCGLQDDEKVSGGLRSLSTDAGDVQVEVDWQSVEVVRVGHMLVRLSLGW